MPAPVRRKAAPKRNEPASARKNFISIAEERVQKMSLLGLIGTAAAIFAGMGVIMNSSGAALDYAVRAWQSGPLPTASRAEVQSLADKTSMQDAEITKQLSTLEMRQGQSIERGAYLAEGLRELQISILKTKLSEAEADMAEKPSDAARALVLQYKTQLEALEAMAMRIQ